MIRKICALVLALVLCFSVAVLPSSATLTGSEKFAVRVELDKANYAAGDDVLIKVFFEVDPGKEWIGGALTLGVNSACFDVEKTTGDNPINTIKANAVGDADVFSWYKQPSASTWSWNTSNTIYNKIVAANTAAENADYNAYLKLVLARDQATGTHPNAAVMTNGIESDLINAADPFITIKLKLKSGLANGTTIKVGVTSGSVTTTDTYLQWLNDPGNASTATKTNADAAYTNITAAVATATIGAAGPKVALAPASEKPTQVKMILNAARDGLDETDGVKNIQLKVKSVITDSDFDTYFANTKQVGVATSETTNMINAVGVVAYAGTGFDADVAKAVVSGTTTNDAYFVGETNYISKASATADAYFGAIIQGTWANTFSGKDVTFLGFVKYFDAAGAAQVIFYEAAVTKQIQQTDVNNYIANFA